MKKYESLLLATLPVMGAGAGVQAQQVQQPQPSAAARPNIVFILADDLGYGDLGCYGQKIIRTPNIDRLANRGVRFVQYYAGAPVSAPSRSTLLSGQHTGHAPVRGNDELADRGNVWSHQAMLDDPSLEGQYPMPAGTRTLGHLMQQSGYVTAMVGKWGLGYPGSTSTPGTMGFDYFCGYMCQRHAHTYYPMYLYENDQRIMLDNAPLLVPTERLQPGDDPRDPHSYDRFTRPDYSGDVMFEALTRFVDLHAGKEPFFLMWTTPIPHVSLQAPARWVEYYHELIGDEEPFTGDSYLPCRYPRATYAAMISYLDEQVGLLVEQLKRLGIYDNTIIVFTSDNGATFNGGTDSPFFNSNGPFDSQYGWGKNSLHEGGIRVPMIFSWPARIDDYRESQLVCWGCDFLPTFAELVGAQRPHEDGISLVGELFGGPQQEHESLYWEYPDGEGQKAVRMGKWKGLLRQVRKGNTHVELFNLETDPREQYDLSAQYPEVVKQIEAIMAREHVESENPKFRF